MFGWFAWRLRHFFRQTWRAAIFSALGEFRPILRALGLGITLVLFASVAAGGVLVFQRFSPWPQFSENSISAPWPACFLSALFSGVYFALRASRAERLAASLTRRLEGIARPDGGYYVYSVELKPKQNATYFARQKRWMPRNCREVLLLAPQISNPKRKYEFASVKQQLEELHKAVRARGCDLRWVCFTTKNGTFVAYQRYDDLFNDIFNKNSHIFIELLNEPDIQKFTEALVKRAPEWQPESELAPYFFLGQTWFKHLPEGQTKRQTLSAMLAENPPLGHVMLVSEPDEIPVGVITVAELVKDLLGRDGLLSLPFKGTKPADGASDDAPDGGKPRDAEDLSEAFAAEGSDASAEAKAQDPALASGQGGAFPAADCETKDTTDVL